MSDLDIRVVGVAELGGAALSPEGLDLNALMMVRDGHGPVWALAGAGARSMSSTELIESVEADCLVEATPTNLTTGAPGLDIVRVAIRRGLDIVLANKAPLVLAFHEITAQTQWHYSAAPTSDLPRLRFSATAAGALPAVQLGQSLVGCRIESIEGVLNGTSHVVLRMMERGVEYEEALERVKAKGMAESDASLDVGGLDAAGKLVILANAVLGVPSCLADVSVAGIDGVTPRELALASSNGCRVVLLASARRTADDWKLDVRPTQLDVGHPLALLGDQDMGVVFVSDRVPRLTATTTEPSGMPAATAVLRDVVALASSRR